MSYVEGTHLMQLSASEPWSADAVLYKPLENSQILPYENSACLSVQVFLHMCGLKFKIEQLANAEYISPSRKLPSLHCGKFIISEPTPIIDFVNVKGYRLDEHLSDDDRAKLKAYMALVNNVLNPAQKYIAWAHEDTSTQITSKRYGSVYPWPLSSILPLMKKNEMLEHLKAIGWGKDDKSLTKIEEEVKRCCTALTEKLGDQMYFFGDCPTELDAVVFGHLYTILTTALPDNRLAAAVQKHPNLVKFCRNIDKQYFAPEETESDKTS